MLQHDKIIFAGYRVPHPLEPVMIMKVRTKSETTPIRAVHDSILALNRQIDILEEQFKVHFLFFLGERVLV